MSTPLNEFVLELTKANPSVLQTPKMLDIYTKHLMDEKRLVINTWEDAIRHYKQSVTTDIMHMSGEDYFESLFG